MHRRSCGELTKINVPSWNQTVAESKRRIYLAATNGIEPTGPLGGMQKGHLSTGQEDSVVCPNTLALRVRLFRGKGGVDREMRKR